MLFTATEGQFGVALGSLPKVIPTVPLIPTCLACVPYSRLYFTLYLLQSIIFNIFAIALLPSGGSFLFAHVNRAQTGRDAEWFRMLWLPLCYTLLVLHAAHHNLATTRLSLCSIHHAVTTTHNIHPRSICNLNDVRNL